MEYIIGLIALVAGAVFFLKKNNVTLERIKFEKEDAVLEAKEDDANAEVDALEARIKRIEDAAKNLKPKDIENYWNDDENS